MPNVVNLPLVIEPIDLFDRLGTDEIRLVDIGSMERYQTGHILGAIGVEPKQIQNQGQLAGLLPSVSQLDALFSHLGHTEDTVYVVYDDEGGGWAGRFIWLLDSIGHKHYHYLNGGLYAWLKEGYSLVKEEPTILPSVPSLTLSDKPTASLAYINDHLNDDGFVIWDARSVAEFLGEKKLANKGGHIPGAVNFEWTKAMDPHNGLRIRTDIANILDELGITPDKEIVTHCQSHHRSGFTYLIAKMLGFPRVKAYAGSWSEWGNDKGTPVE